MMKHEISIEILERKLKKNEKNSKMYVSMFNNEIKIKWKLFFEIENVSFNFHCKHMNR